MASALKILSTARLSAVLLSGFGLCFGATHAFAQQLTSQAESANPAMNLDQIYGGFSGDWVGQLQYRDFSNNSCVFLPTWLHVSRAADGRSLQFKYTYDDGPTKTVKEISILTIDPKAGTLTIASDRDRTSDVYKLSGLAAFSAAGGGTLNLTGTGTENDKQVDVRITITVARNLYTFQKETRLAGADFQFRDAYTLTRKDSPE